MISSELREIVDSMPPELVKLRSIGEEILACRTTKELEQVIIRQAEDEDNPKQVSGLIQMIYQASRTDELWKIASISKAIVKAVCHLEDAAQYSKENNVFSSIINAFGNIAAEFWRQRLHAAATSILIDLWNELADYQLTLNSNKEGDNLIHVYRAGVAMYLGRLYMELRDEYGAAIWWLLHAHADDLLKPFDGGAAHDMLRLGFNVAEETFVFMRQCANEIIRNGKRNELFAEHVVMRLSLKREYNHQFSYPTSLVEFPAGRAYVSSMIDAAKQPQKVEPSESDNRKSSRDGKILENLARYLVLLLAGWVPTDNIYHNRTRIDSDLIARYTREPEAISTSYGRAILAECKNYQDNISVSQAGYFLYRMHLMHVKTGILFAANNVSGYSDLEEGEKNAAHLLELAFQRDGSAVAVLDLKDIERIAEGKQTVWSLIDNRVAERRFGKPSRAE